MDLAHEDIASVRFDTMQAISFIGNSNLMGQKSVGHLEVREGSFVALSKMGGKSEGVRALCGSFSHIHSHALSTGKSHPPFLFPRGQSKGPIDF